MHLFLYASMTRALTQSEIKRLGGDAVWILCRLTRWAQPSPYLRHRGDAHPHAHRFRYSASLIDKESNVAWAASDHDRSFKARFPMLPDVEMEHRWGGRLCLSWHGDPAFGEVEEGIFSACCQNGLGASTGILNGMLSADLATGRDNPYVDQFLAMDEPPACRRSRFRLSAQPFI